MVRTLSGQKWRPLNFSVDLSEVKRIVISNLNLISSPAFEKRHFDALSVAGLLAQWQKSPNIAQILKFIYYEKATNFCQISIVVLYYVVMVKSTVDISRNIWPFSKYMNFTFFILVNYYFGFSKCEEDENAPFKNSFSPLCILKKVSKRDRPPVKSPN